MYVGTVAGVEGDARLAYRDEDRGVVAATHTETSGALRGRGITLKLVQRLVEDARREGLKIRALCSYVEHERQNHPELRDVFVTNGR